MLRRYVRKIARVWRPFRRVILSRDVCGRDEQGNNTGLQKVFKFVHRPKIILNFAMTVDGKVSTAKRTPSGFTSDIDKRRLLEIRALGDALMAGRNTVAIDRMSMGLPDESLRKARTERGQSPYPLRVMISNSGDFPADLEVFKHTFSPILIYPTPKWPPSRKRKLRERTSLNPGEGNLFRLPEFLNALKKTPHAQ